MFTTYVRWIALAMLASACTSTHASDMADANWAIDGGSDGGKRTADDAHVPQDAATAPVPMDAAPPAPTCDVEIRDDRCEECLGVACCDWFDEYQACAAEALADTGDISECFADFVELAASANDAGIRNPDFEALVGCILLDCPGCGAPGVL
jgi:hypothetical protein